VTSPDKDEATRFFTTAADNLHRVGQRAGVQRLVVVSIIGIDRLTPGYGYNAAKLAHERAALSGPVRSRPGFCGRRSSTSSSGN
jgi:uncharacterized protein YbjT (DUF2867 family)